jgi:hypothetical protein
MGKFWSEIDLFLSPDMLFFGLRTQQWINLEPCGLFCGSITWFLLIYAMYVTSVSLIRFHYR